MEFVTLAVILIFVAYKLSETKANERSLNLLKKYESDFKNAAADFQDLIHGSWYISDRQYRLWKDKYGYLNRMIDPVFGKIKTRDPFKKLVMDFSGFWHEGRKFFIDDFNEKFVEKESPIIRRILNEKEIQNNDDQVTAIASDEDNTLLVAGAGTGKTTAILGKLAYLMERAEVKPEDILLLSFTGRAVEELSDRIGKKFSGKNITVRTFHGFGLFIIGKALGKKPDLAFSSGATKQKFLDEQFDLCLGNTEYLHKAAEYFAYYFKPIVLEPGFKNLDDYYKYAKTEQNLTLRKERLKSQQEVMIANFLYLNGIEYVYEKPYKHNTADSEHRQYRPDFYLPDHDIYIEHFGVNRKGEVRFTKNEAQNLAKTKKYKEEMAWKRELHQARQTKLVETFSYEFTERNWKVRLAEKLQAHKVDFSERNTEEIRSTIIKSDKVKKIGELFGTFLDLSKSNGYTLLKLKNIVLSRNNPREFAFFDIFSPIYESYEAELSRTNSIDFHDMLIKAADFINEGRYKTNFKYIIIDEFQDFSESKSRLVKALCEQNPDTKLFCVGDDWQSIFRFAGSDISLMTKFEESYGFTRQNKLIITNRFNNKIAVVSNKFILKNTNQIRKEVRARPDKTLSGEAVEILYRRKANDTEQLLEEILSTLDKNKQGEQNTATVFLLGRYKYNKPADFSRYQKQYKNLSIEFLTIHASKGSEADYVIITDVLSGKYGFPSEVTDDPLLEIVLSKEDSYPHAEERRLMYVAMTRARHKVFIITEFGKQSVFVLELEGFKNSDTAATVRCKECGGEMIKRQSRYGAFYGCVNFPECTYTVNIRRAHK